MKLTSSLALVALSTAALAQDRPAVVVTVRNNAPMLGTFQTPVWVGFHDGSFDSYDGGTLASDLPLQGSDAIERIAEDGNPGPLSSAFAQLQPTGAQGVIFSNDPNLPVHAPGRQASRLFEIDPGTNPFFSYVSMVIPSNDAFVANGGPTAHPIFDGGGNFIGAPFTVFGTEINDAGTELNDEVPANTAFFGQMSPDTGVTTNDFITAHPGFLVPGSGGILDDPMFLNADFLAPGYEAMDFEFTYLNRGARLRRFARLNGANETMPNNSAAIGAMRVDVAGALDTFRVLMFADGLSSDVTGAHLHLGLPGQDGPVTLDLTDSLTPLGPDSVILIHKFDASDLQGVLAGEADPIGALMAELVSGNVYVNLHTTTYPAGEIRGQL